VNPRRLRFPLLVGAVALLALACAAEEETRPAFTGDISNANPAHETTEPVTATGDAPEESPLDEAASAQLDEALGANAEGCEILDTRSCLLPFPSDAYTVEDTASPTGRFVDLPEGLLANADGVPLDPTEWNRNDGFSPSTPILVHVPGLDPDQTDLPTEGDIGASVEDGSATVLVDLSTGQRVPHWAELDQRAEADEDRLLIIRPAVSLPETRRFAVAVQNVRDADGNEIEAPIGFRVLRDNHPTDVTEIEERRSDHDEVFSALSGVGVNRADTYVAWTFTVASSETLAGRMLSMRDDAFGRLAGGAPEFAVTATRDDVRDGVAHIVDGTFEVPLFLEGDGAPGSPMVFGENDDRPVASGTYTANFTCVVPEEGVTDGGARPVVYGHGLLGSATSEVASSHVQHTVSEINALYCGTDWIGMSGGDVGYAVEALSDINRFPAMADRMQQGILNMLYLGRLMLHDEGLASHEAFQTEDGESAIDHTSAYYDGNSQGAIMGGAVTAVAQDWTKAVLGVGGMNYSTLLNRSVDFDEYAVVLRGAYPNALDQQIVFGILQMLWDRGETSGYVQHLTDRAYNRTPPKQVLMTVAYGDHQVATITAENIARTLNIPVYDPVLPDGVSPLENPFWNLSTTGQFPIVGSALYFWYSGTLAPPEGNITPRMSEEYLANCIGENVDDEACRDPHEDPRRQPAIIDQKNEFFTVEGEIINACRDEPCRAAPRAEFDY
jgi:hypothetical protein